MLRVGLTGELGSGKSTVARMLADHGAIVLSSDEMGRAMMEPGERVYEQIVQLFGPTVVMADRTLDRRELARVAFAEGRVEELNEIVHPAVLREQAKLIAMLKATNPQAIVVIESALLFSTKTTLGGQSWRERFDRIILVTAPEKVKIARYVARVTMGRYLPDKECEIIKEDARRRIATQKIDRDDATGCIVIRNEGGLSELHEKVDATWRSLKDVQKTVAS